MAHPRPLLHLFSGFSNSSIHFLQQLNVKNDAPSSMHCQNLNSHPLEHQSPPLAARPLERSSAIFYDFNRRAFTPWDA